MNHSLSAVALHNFVNQWVDILGEAFLQQQKQQQITE